jgi:hypothetical protein
MTLPDINNAMPAPEQTSAADTSGCRRATKG